MRNSVMIQWLRWKTSAFRVKGTSETTHRRTKAIQRRNPSGRLLLPLALVLMAAPVVPLPAQQFDGCYEYCHWNAMMVYFAVGEEAAAYDFEQCMKRNCGGM